jgi:tetratricopeptide (TPR) repeat protein
VRLWVFRIVTAIALPVLVLISIEAGLRLFNVGYRSEFTVPCTMQGQGAYCDNDYFTWQFFPPGLFRLPPAFAMKAEKQKGTFRIFIVGESAAVGVPEPSYSFGRYLEVMLRDRFPATRFEVINTAITSVNSHVLLPAVRDLARRDGDLFIMYIGNNEVVGPYGAGTTLTRQGGSLALIRASILLNSTRLGQVLGGGMRAVAGGGASPREWQGMRMFLDQQVPADSSALAQVYDNFQSNLRDIVAAAKSSGAPILISTVGVNLKDGAPFASVHRADLTAEQREAWDAQLRDGKELQDAGKYSEALEPYLKAAAIDDRHAELQYRIGQVYWQLGEFSESKKRFALARDLDSLRFRADDRLNAITRQVAKEAGPGVELIDGEQLFAEESPHGVPGRELFYEHVHMNPHGNYLLARALFPRVVAQLPEEVRRAATNLEPPSEAEANQLLALTAHDRRRVARTVTVWLSQPPFTGRFDNDEQVQAMRQEAEGEEKPDETAASYAAAIDKAPDDRWLRFNHGLALEPQDPAAAAAEFRRALDLLPTNYEVREKVADALIDMGRYEEAIAESRKLLEQMPYHAPAYLTMAYAQAKLGSFDESIATYERAIAMHPAYAPDAYNQIGIIQLHQDKFDLAQASFEKAIAADASKMRFAELGNNLSVALLKQGKYAEARRVLEDVKGSLARSTEAQGQPASAPQAAPPL